MKKLTIKTADSTLTLENGYYKGRKAVLNIGYPELENYCGKYLTAKQAKRLEDWLRAWRQEKVKP